MLHIIKSREGFEAAKSYCSDHDSFLLIEDAVYLSVCLDFKQKGIKSADVNLYALENDIKARGLSVPSVVPIKLVDYKGFVSLTAQCENSMTWQ